MNTIHLLRLGHRIFGTVGALALFLMGFTTGSAQIAGTLDTDFAPQIEDGVSVIAIQPDGHILAAGTHWLENQVLNGYVLRLFRDGQRETAETFNVGTGPNDAVACLAVQSDGKIVIGGRFTEVNGMARNRIARLNRDGSVEDLSTFNAGTVSNSGVGSIAIQPDGKILIGGDFTQMNGQPRGGIARLMSDGTLESLSTFDTSVSLAGWGPVGRLIVQEDGKIVVDGARRLHPNGALDSTFQKPWAPPDSVFSFLATPSGGFLLGGRFPMGSVPNQTVFGVMNVSSTGSVVARYLPVLGRTDLSTSVYGLALQTDGKLLAGGYWNVPPFHIARLNPDGSSESSATFSASLFGGGISVLALEADGGIIIGGGFDGVNGQPQAKLARLLNDPATQTLTIIGGTAVKWLRGGAAPEVSLITFERSTDSGQTWTMLGRGTRIAGGWQLTGLTLSADAAIRARGRTGDGRSTGIVEQLINVPEIVVELPVGTRLTDNKSTVDFGPVTAGTTGTKTITLRNPGTVPVQNIAVSIPAGGNAGDYAVTQPASPSLTAGATATFDVMFTPGAAGVRTATVLIASSDLDENPFQIALTGSRATASEAWRQAHFGSPYNTGAGADLSDPESDGIVNLMEFATVGDPLAPTPSIGQLVATGNVLEFTYTRPVAALEELTYALEAAASLSSAWNTTGMTTSILSDDGVIQLVKVTTSTGALGRRFVRLRVTKL